MGKTVILDPAPAAPVPEDVLAMVDYITPNESELVAITPALGKDADAPSRVKYLLDLGVGCVINKSGGNGAYVAARGAEVVHVPGFKVKVVDTTAAATPSTPASPPVWRWACRRLTRSRSATPPPRSPSPPLARRAACRAWSSSCRCWRMAGRKNWGCKAPHTKPPATTRGGILFLGSVVLRLQLKVRLRMGADRADRGADSPTWMCPQLRHFQTRTLSFLNTTPSSMFFKSAR